MEREAIGLQLALTLKHIGKMMQNALSQGSQTITIEQYILLNFLSSADEKLTQQELATLLNKDKSAVLRQIESLTDKQLVVRIVDKIGKRKKRLCITEKGIETMQKIKKIEAKAMTQLIEKVPDSHLSTFVEILELIRK